MNWFLAVLPVGRRVPAVFEVRTWRASAVAYRCGATVPVCVYQQAQTGILRRNRFSCRRAILIWIYGIVSA